MTMIAVAPPPPGSAVTSRNEPDHTALSWSNPGAAVGRLVVGLFLLFWLGGWAWGLVSVGGMVLRDGPLVFQLFLAFWLAVWAAGGAFALYVMADLLRAPAHASLRLQHDRLLYHAGWVPRGRGRAPAGPRTLGCSGADGGS